MSVPKPCVLMPNKTGKRKGEAADKIEIFRNHIKTLLTNCLQKGSKCTFQELDERYTEVFGADLRTVAMDEFQQKSPLDLLRNCDFLEIQQDQSSILISLKTFREGPFAWFNNRPIDLNSLTNYTTLILDFNNPQVCYESELCQAKLDKYPLGSQLLENVALLGVEKLNNPQSYIVPFLFTRPDSDLVIRIPRRSGLSFALALPAVSHIVNFKMADDNISERTGLAPYVIVIAEKETFVANLCGLYSCLAYKMNVICRNYRSNASMEDNMVTLQRGTDVFLCTAAALSTLIRNGQMNLDFLKLLIIDGADKVFKEYGLDATAELIRAAAGDDVVRVLGCEFIYESRIPAMRSCLRSNAVEFRCGPQSSNSFLT